MARFIISTTPFTAGGWTRIVATSTALSTSGNNAPSSSKLYSYQGKKKEKSTSEHKKSNRTYRIRLQLPLQLHQYRAKLILEQPHNPLIILLQHRRFRCACFFWAPNGVQQATPPTPSSSTSSHLRIYFWGGRHPQSGAQRTTCVARFYAVVEPGEGNKSVGECVPNIARTGFGDGGHLPMSEGK